MNEKIKQLAEQAGHSPDSFDKYCKTLHPLWNTHISRTYAEQFFYAGLNAQLDLEKFAELIVRECMSITDKCSTGPGLHDLFADNIIAEHFGVEE